MMKTKYTAKTAVIILLFIIGLTPFLWFRGGTVIDGADINFSLRPVQEFFHRTQAWDSVYQGGHDNVLNLPTLVYSGIQAGIYSITGSLLWTEKLSFVFWFMFSGFSIYALIDSLILKGKSFLVKLMPCLFYQFNFYQLSCWTGVHIAGITALAVLPVMFGLFIKIIDGERVFANTVFFSIFSVISGGIWVNPPLVIVLGSVFIIYRYFITCYNHMIYYIIFLLNYNERTNGTCFINFQ